MFDILSPLQPFLKISSVRCNSILAMLHYRVTVALLLGLSALLALRSWNPIECYTSGFKHEEAIDLHCLISGIYALAYSTGEYVPEIGQELSDQIRRPLYYYPFLPIILFVQALLFYFPRYVFMMAEDKTIKDICTDPPNTTTEEEVQREQTKKIVRFFLEFPNKNDLFVIKIAFLHLLFVFNIVIQIVILNLILPYNFLKYGIHSILVLLSKTTFNYTYFPLMAKCGFSSFGVGGLLSEKDALCILPVNCFARFTFAFEFFWFNMLLILSLLQLFVLNLCLFSYVRKYLLVSILLPVDKRVVHDVVENMKTTDFIVLYIIGTNIDKCVLREALSLMRKKPKLV